MAQYGHSDRSYGVEVAEAQPILQPQPIDLDNVQRPYRDRAFGVLFWVHVLIMAIVGFALGPRALSEDAKRPPISTNDHPTSLFNFDSTVFFGNLVLSAVVAAFLSAGAFILIQRAAGRLIKTAILLTIGINIVVAGISFTVSPVLGILMLVCAACGALFYWFVRKRIPFAAAVLEVATAAVKAHRKGIFLVASLMVVVQLLWAILWLLAIVGIEAKVNGDLDAPPGTAYAAASQSSAGGVLAFFLLVSFYWGTYTFRSVVHYTTSGVVGEWWSRPSTPFVPPSLALPGDAIPAQPASSSSHGPNPVKTYLRYAMTTSFGSLSLGSLIVAIITAAHRMVKGAQRRNNGQGGTRSAGAAICLAVSACFLKLLEDAVKYFNSWAFTFAALSGEGFITSAKEAVRLFTERGWSAIVNDDLVSKALGLVCVGVGIIAAAVGGGVAYASMGRTDSGAATIIAVLAFCVGFGMATIMSSVISSSVRTVFVCFARDPVSLGKNHPLILRGLVDAWEEHHPVAYRTSQYPALLAPLLGSTGRGGSSDGGGEGGSSVPLAYPPAPHQPGGWLAPAPNAAFPPPAASYGAGYPGYPSGAQQPMAYAVPPVYAAPATATAPPPYGLPPATAPYGVPSAHPPGNVPYGVPDYHADGRYTAPLGGDDVPRKGDVATYV